MLKVILIFGKNLNDQLGALGFDFETISNLSSVKTTDKKSNFLIVILKELRNIPDF